MNFHLQQESIIYQVRWIVEKLILTRKLAIQNLSGTVNQSSKNAKSLDSLLKVGILLHDIFPQSSETLCWALLDHLLHNDLLTNDQIAIISRRKDLDKYAPNAYKTIQVVWDFSDPKFIDGFDLIVICGTNMNVPMLKELFCNQNLYQTVAIMTIPGVLQSRIQSILDSELVVMCNFTQSDYKQSDLKNSTNVVNMENLPLNLNFPDLECVNQLLTAYCLRAGLKTQQSASIAAKVVPKNEAKAKEEFIGRNLPRLKYWNTYPE